MLQNSHQNHKYLLLGNAIRQLMSNDISNRIYQVIYN